MKEREREGEKEIEIERERERVCDREIWLHLGKVQEFFQYTLLQGYITGS